LPGKDARKPALDGVLDVAARHLAFSKAEDVSDRLVLQPVGLPLKRFAFEIADRLPDLGDDRAILSSMKADRLDVRTDHCPLARPVRAYGLAAMDMAAIHTVRPGDIVGERGQYPVYVSRVEAIVEAFKAFLVIVHWVSPRLCARVALQAALNYICTYASAGRCAQRVNVMELDVLSTPGHLISLAARGFARLSEARLKPLGFGVGHLPVLVLLQDSRASTQRDLARFAKIEQPPMAQMLARMERDGLIQRTPDPADGRSRRITLTKVAKARLPDAVAVLLRGNHEVLRDFTDEEAGLLVALLTRLIANLDRVASVEASPGAPISEKGRAD
jgi:MarR family transcriptional regulator, transcriptional regulator for hemolysin